MNQRTANSREFEEAVQVSISRFVVAGDEKNKDGEILAAWNLPWMGLPPMSLAS